MVSGQNLEVCSLSAGGTIETSNQTHLNTGLAFIVVFNLTKFCLSIFQAGHMLRTVVLYLEGDILKLENGRQEIASGADLAIP